MATQIYLTAGAADPDLALGRNCQYPKDFRDLDLNEVLNVIRFIGSCFCNLEDQQPRIGVIARKASMTELVVECAHHQLSNWPLNFKAALKETMAQALAANQKPITLANVFGRFYSHLYRHLEERQHDFLRDAFEQFVTYDWEGPLTRQHKRLKGETVEKFRVRTGELLKTQHQLSNHQGIRECDSGKTSSAAKRTKPANPDTLPGWSAVIDRSPEKIEMSMTRCEAATKLRLRPKQIDELVASGVIRGERHGYLSIGAMWRIRKEDVSRVLASLESFDALPVMSQLESGLLDWNGAIRRHRAGRGSLGYVMAAILEERLHPVGRAKADGSVFDLIFVLEDLLATLRQGLNTTQRDYFLANEVKTVLGTCFRGVRWLIQNEYLSMWDLPHFGPASYIRASDVVKFRETYISTRELSAHMNIRPSQVRSKARQLGIESDLDVPTRNAVTRFYRRDELIQAGIGAISSPPPSFEMLETPQ